MGVVLCVAVAFGALRNTSMLWASAAFTLTALVLLSAILLALRASGRSRSFWLGFIVFGWGHFLLGFWPSREGTPMPDFLLALVLEYFSTGLRYGFQTAWLNTARYDYPGPFTYEQIAISVSTLILASIGGALASRLLAGGRSSDKPAPVSRG
jgi:hypothetical protein